MVDQLDLGQLGFAMPQATEGRPPYAPSLLLKIWLYGYLHGIRSTRQIERACREQIALIWLSGMLAPDHNSLWRFWRDNKKQIGALFNKSISLAMEAGLVGVVVQALDGTKIKAASSSQTGWSKEYMQKLLVALEEEIKKAEEQIEEEGPGGEGPRYKLPEKLEDKQALREVVKSGLAKLEQDGRQHYHPGEPQAHRMKCEGTKPFGYNAQAVVDAGGIVVAAAVVTEETDRHQLVTMVEQAKVNLGSQGEKVVTVADGGYGTGEQVAQAEEKKLNVLVRPCGTAKPDDRYDSSHFRYDAAPKTLACPEGQMLEFAREAQQKGQTVQVYKCYKFDCPVRAHCTKDKKGRKSVEVWSHTPAVQAMRDRLKQPHEEALLKKRSQIVERHFGHIKEHDRFRRWTVRGLANVQAQWALINLTINLRALYKNWLTKRPTCSGGPNPSKTAQSGSLRRRTRRHVLERCCRRKLWH